MHAIKKLRHYIVGYQTFVHTNHFSNLFLMNNPVTNARVTRWLLLLQDFDITIIDKPGKDNVVEDFLSTLADVTEDFPVSICTIHLFTLVCRHC